MHEPRKTEAEGQWIRGYVCAVATHWLQTEDPTTAKDMLHGVGKMENIIKHADAEDLATLRNAGLVPRADLEELKRRRNVCGKPLHRTAGMSPKHEHTC